jgi:hypothetical protein
MANLHKYTVQEALNAQGSGGVWTVNAVGASLTSADVTGTVHLDVSGASQLGVYALTSDIYFSFSASATDIDTDNDLRLTAKALTFFTVPKGLGATIYFNYLSASTTAGTVRTVEV